MGFYIAHIAISNKHLLVFVLVASVYEERSVHRGFTAYRLAVHILCCIKSAILPVQV